MPRPLLPLLCLLLVAPQTTVAQARDTTLRSRVAAWRGAREPAIVRELIGLLELPNLASDSVNIRRNAAHIVAMLERRGISARLLETPGSPPAVYGELRVPGAQRTVVLYSHYDGQPVDTGRWASRPWTPILRDGALTTGAKQIPFPADGGRSLG